MKMRKAASGRTKVAMSRGDWKRIGKVAGWQTKLADADAMVAEDKPMLSDADRKRIAAENLAKALIPEDVESTPELFDPSKISDAGKSIAAAYSDWEPLGGDAHYYLLTDGSLFMWLDGELKIITDKNEAKQLWDVRELDPTDKLCSGCFSIAAAEKSDFGIGPYEFWGSREVHHDWQNASKCCAQDFVDKYGRPTESPEPSEPDYDDRD